MSKFALGYFVGGALVLLITAAIGSFDRSIEYKKVINACEQKLLQDNAPRSIVCEISAIAVDKQINGESK